MKDLIRNALAAESMGVLQFFRGNLWSNSCLIWEASQSWETVRSWKVQRDVAAPQWRGFQSRRLQIRPDSLVPYRDRRVQVMLGFGDKRIVFLLLSEGFRASKCCKSAILLGPGFFFSFPLLFVVFQIEILLAS